MSWSKIVKKKVLLQSSHFGQWWLCCFQVAGPACLDFGRGFGTPIGVATVVLCHGFNIAAAPHPPTWDVIFFSQWRKAAPFILRYLKSNQEGQRNSQEHTAYYCHSLDERVGVCLCLIHPSVPLLFLSHPLSLSFFTQPAIERGSFPYKPGPAEGFCLLKGVFPAIYVTRLIVSVNALSQFWL